MSSPKEKAEELVDKFEEFADDMECNVFTSSENRFKNAKQCALIAVDEILSIPYLLKYESWFYKEVKQEIEKL
jgi:hypothetical protein